MMLSSLINASTASTAAVPIILLDIGLMAILVIVAFAIVRMRSLFAIVMLQGVYSLVSAAWFVSLDAVDVAFTEAAVGAGVSTVLMLSAMLLADRKSAPIPMSRQWGALAVVVTAGAAMIYAVGDMPGFGDADSAANSYVGMDYIARTADEIHIPNVVTAVLASYRGYDTFGEVVVIFSAGLGVLLLLGLNGHAGFWQAKPNGQRLSSPFAPMPNRELQPVEAIAKKKRGRPKGSKNKAKPAQKRGS
jgi:multicomponent Na+:H+ antiporter subunit B